MSAWYIFSAMGFYPVNPVSGEYVVGSYVVVLYISTIWLMCSPSPFFSKISIDLPPRPHDDQTQREKRKTLTIVAKDAATKPYIKSLTINGRKVYDPIVRHEDIAQGGTIVFEMSEKVEAWGNSILVGIFPYVCCML
jgi:putative alpha-1,2-mannosidase